MASNKSSMIDGLACDNNAIQSTVTTSTNTPEPKINAQKRVIKQIVSIDSKKLKELGIESNIISAMTKFSEKRISNPATISPLDSMSASPVPTPSRGMVLPPEFICQTQSNPILQPGDTQSSNVASSVPTPPKSMDSNKKVHVLSQVILPGSTAINLEALSKIGNRVESILIKGKSSSPNRVSTHHDNTINQIVPEQTPHDSNLTGIPNPISENNAERNIIDANDTKFNQESVISSAMHECLGFELDMVNDQRTKISSIDKYIANFHGRITNTQEVIDDNCATSAFEHASDDGESSQTASLQSEGEGEETIEELARRAGEILKDELGEDFKYTQLGDDEKDKDKLIDDFLDATKNGFQLDMDISSSSESSFDVAAVAFANENDADHKEKRNRRLIKSPPPEQQSMQTKEIELINVFPLNNEEILLPPPPDPSRSSLNNSSNIFKAISSPETRLDSCSRYTKQKKLTEFLGKSSSASPKASKSPQSARHREHSNAEADVTGTTKRKRSISNYNDLLNMCSTKLSKNRAETLDTLSKYISENISNSDDGENANASEKGTVPFNTSTPVEKKRRGRKKKIVSNAQSELGGTAIHEEETNIEEQTAPDNSLTDLSIKSIPVNNESAGIRKPGRRGRKPKLQVEDALETSPVNLTENNETILEEDTSLNIIESIDGAQQSTSLKKGTRGRRKKIHQELDTNLSTDDEATVAMSTAVQKPHRTRQTRRKNKHEIKQEDDSMDVIQDVHDSIETNPVQLEAEPKGRRSRKPKPQNISDMQRPEAIIESEVVETPPLPRKRGKTSNSLTKEPDEQPSIDDLIQSLSLLNSQGRPSKADMALREKLEKQIRATMKEFTCGNCKKQIPIKSWQKHGTEHYGIYWRDGIDMPIDLTDMNQQQLAITRYLKINKSMRLACAKCGLIKKSAVGYLSHVEICGLDAEGIVNMKVQCDLCKGLYKKSSLQIHIQGFCPVRRAMIAEENKAKAPVEDANETGSISIEYTGSGRARRKAAHSNYKNLIDANAGDNDSDGSFVCSNGSSSSDSMSNEGDTEGEESVINSDHSEFLDNDREERRARRRKAKKERKEKRKLADNLVKPDAIMVQRHYDELRIYRTIFFSPAKRWTEEFRAINHFGHETPCLEIFLPTSPALTTIAKSNTSTLPICSESPNFCHSVRTSYPKVSLASQDSYDWQILKCCEGKTYEESSTIFSGGRILAAEWAPFPNTYEGDEILAVCVHSDTKYAVTVHGALEPVRCFIQIWSIPTEKKRGTPKMLYAIDCDDGPTMAVEFCPSGGYIANKRLGLLAVATYDGTVNILALPSVDEMVDDQSGDGGIRLVKAKPALSLRCTLSRERQRTSTQIRWSQSKGHATIAAAYADGLIAIWNLDNMKFAHLQQTTDGRSILQPYKMFYSTLSYITQLDMHHDSENQARWLLTGSLDRRIKLFDMENAVPIEVSSSYLRSRIRSGYWPLHWNVHLSVIDDSMAFRNGGLIQKQPLNICQGLTATLIADGDPSTLAFSDWLNTSVFGTSHGDIFVNYSTQLLRGISSKNNDARAVIGFTDVATIKSNNTNSKKSRKVSGLVFCDFPSPITLKKARKRRIFPLNIKPIMKIDHIRFNPNQNACKMYAIGYQNGLIRIKTLTLIERN